MTTTEPYCLRCGKFTPSKPWNGWEKKEIELADLENPHANECEVCKMMIKGLRAYRDMVIPDMPLPTSISVKCAPGHSFYVQKAVKRTSNSSRISINATPRRNDSEVENLQKQDIVGFDGLEFFVVPGECVPSAIILC
jgi:hypothetical protein